MATRTFGQPHRVQVPNLRARNANVVSQKDLGKFFFRTALGAGEI